MMKFRAVDAQTGGPIAGVVVEQKDEFDIVSGWFRTESQVLAPTGLDGSTIAWDVRPQRNHFFRFSKNGYADVIVTQGQSNPSVLDIDQSVYGGDGSKGNASDNPFQVPMYRFRQPTTSSISKP
jgi:hypothetical protein